MSQSDYLKYKRIKTTLKIDTIINKDVKPQAPVFTSGDLLGYKQFSLENQIFTTKPVLNRLTLSGENMIFGMEIDSVANASCSPFIIGIGTNERTNRVPMLSVYSDPKPVSMNIHNIKMAKQMKTDAYNYCACPKIPADYFVHFDATTFLVNGSSPSNARLINVATNSIEYSTATIGDYFIKNTANNIYFIPNDKAIIYENLDISCENTTTIVVVKMSSGSNKASLYGLFQNNLEYGFEASSYTSFLYTDSAKVGCSDGVIDTSYGSPLITTDDKPFIVSIQRTFNVETGYTYIFDINGHVIDSISSTGQYTYDKIINFTIGSVYSYMNELNVPSSNNISIGELYGYDRVLTTTEKTTILSNLSRKWGVSLY
jgi:hypothetical protein